MKPFTSKKVLF